MCGGLKNLRFLPSPDRRRQALFTAVRCMQEKGRSANNESAANAKSKADSSGELRRKLGPDQIKIWKSFAVIFVLGVGLFAAAKNEISQSRQDTMKMKKDIFTNHSESVRFPTRRETIEAARQQQQKST